MTAVRKQQWKTAKCRDIFKRKELSDITMKKSLVVVVMVMFCACAHQESFVLHTRTHITQEELCSYLERDIATYYASPISDKKLEELWFLDNMVGGDDVQRILISSTVKKLNPKDKERYYSLQRRKFIAIDAKNGHDVNDRIRYLPYTEWAASVVNDHCIKHYHTACIDAKLSNTEAKQIIWKAIKEKLLFGLF